MTKSLKILFGAGASYGAGSILPERPPLGNKLFSELKRIYPKTWGLVGENLQEVFLENFELGMKNIWENNSHSVPPLMQNMSEYFIQFRPINNASLYCKLIKFLEYNSLIDTVSFTSLNYDIVLELSLLSNGYSPNYFHPKSNEVKAVEVLKIHGSSNFIGTGIEAGKGISYGSGAIFNGGIKASFNTSEVIETFLVRSGIAPVMSLYMEGKPVNVSPQIIQDLQNTSQNRCLAAKTIIIVGIKPIKADMHIWDSITKSKAGVYYVGSNSDFLILKEMGINAHHLGEYFNTSFKHVTNVIYDNN